MDFNKVSQHLEIIDKNKPLQFQLTHGWLFAHNFSLFYDFWGFQHLGVNRSSNRYSNRICETKQRNRAGSTYINLHSNGLQVTTQKYIIHVFPLWRPMQNAKYEMQKTTKIALAEVARCQIFVSQPISFISKVLKSSRSEVFFFSSRFFLVSLCYNK